MDRRKGLRVLLAVDDGSAGRAIAGALREEGFVVDETNDASSALAFATAAAPDLLITVDHSATIDGVELMRRLRAVDPTLPVLALTGDSADSSIGMLRAGADERLDQPVNLDTLLVLMERAFELRDLRRESAALRDQVHDIEDASFDGLVGTSPPMMAVYTLARRVAGVRANVLVSGERGTGRTRLARAIHEASTRRCGPFVVVDCPELTGSAETCEEVFRGAAGGTVFLKEVSALSLSMQTEILGVLDRQRLSGNAPEAGAVRVLASTKRDLRTAAAEHRFREELAYRLDVVHITMPPLRERGADIQLLADHFLRRFAAEHRRAIEGFSEGARVTLATHPWPGNLDELQSIVERAVLRCRDALIDRCHLPKEVLSLKAGNVVIPGSSMADIEKYAIVATLEATNGSTTRAAKILDMSVRTIQYRLAQYGIKAPRGARPPAE